MSKRNVWMLILAALALTAFSYALSRRDSRDWRAVSARRLLPFPWQDARVITLSRPEQPTIIMDKNAVGEWLARTEGNIPDLLNIRIADELAALGALAQRIPLPDTPAPDPAVAAALTVTPVSGQAVTLIIGDASGAVRPVAIADEPDAVYGVSADLLGFLGREPSRFRNLYLAQCAAAKPDAIVLSPPGAHSDPSLTVELRLANRRWELTRPMSWPADPGRVDALLQWFDRLRASEVIANRTDLPEAYGFDDDSPYLEIHLSAGNRMRRVEFGDYADAGGIYARVAGRPAIFTIPRGMLAELAFFSAERRPEAWKNQYRSRRLDEAGDSVPSRIVVERLLPEPAVLTLDAPKSGQKTWRGTLECNGSKETFSVDPPSGTRRPLGRLLEGLADLRIREFLADAEPGPETIKWTAYPAWRFRLHGRDGGEAPVLTLYAKDAEGTLPPGVPYVSGDERPQTLDMGVGVACTLSNRAAVLEVAGVAARALCLPLYRYRSAKVMDVAIDDWTRVTIAQGENVMEYFRIPGDINEQWWRDGEEPSPLLDDNNRFVALLSEVSQLRSDGFVDDGSGDIADFGLDRPALTAIVTIQRGQGGTGDGPAFTLSLGGTTPSGGRYARLGDEGPVFVVPANLADALQKEYR